VSKVSILKCEDYDQEKVDKVVRESVELIGGLGDIIHPKDKVLLKVNMLNADPPEKAVTTHPAIVKAAIRLVKRAGGVPFVGDASGVAYTHKDAEIAWQKTGLKKAAEEEGAEVINFREVKEINNPKNRKVPTLHIAKEVLDADVVISLPKLKTHSFALFTGAIKNLYGTIPGFRKKELHAKVPKPKDFAELVVDILSVVYPKLSIMDGIVGMEGNGPAAGPPRKIGVILASRDPVAVDAVASSIIGYHPFDIDIIKAAYRRGLGEARLERIDIRGASLDEVRIEDFELISNINTLLNRLPGFVLAIGKLLAPYFLKVEPEVNREKCKGCQVCVKHCPTEAMRLASSYAKIDKKKCIKCFCCQEFCPHRAVEIKYNWLAKRLKI